MAMVTFRDLREHLRCPYEHILRSRSGSTAITLEECMDMSVHDALLFADHTHIMRGRVRRDDVMSMFWDSWDRHLPDVYPAPEDTAAMIRFGEKCVDSHLHTISNTVYEFMSSAGIGGVVDLPGGEQVLTQIDSVWLRGQTATVCRYVCEPGLRSSKDLSEDLEMRLCALWALRNISGIRNVNMRWEFLGCGASSECRAPRESLERLLPEVEQRVRALGSASNILPRETEHCSECMYSQTCPRKLHELSLGDDPGAFSRDEGVRLADEYADLQEKIDALKGRQKVLEAKQRAVAESLADYSDATGYMAVAGHGCKVLVRHESKVDLPEDKTAIIERLRATGQYDSISMPNYPRLRSDIAKGLADPEIARMATISDVRKLYIRRRPEE